MAKTAGEAAREARLATGISQRLAAQAAGMNQVALFRIEQSKAEHLPHDVVDRLADVYAQFGVAREYLRRFAPPGSYPDAANASLPELRPKLLSTFERAAIRRRMKKWFEERDLQARTDFLARVEPLKRAIVEGFVRRHPDAAPYDAYYALADTAVLVLAEDLSSKADVEEQLEDAIEALITRYYRCPSDFLMPTLSMQQWQWRVVSRIHAASIRQQQGDTVPVFKCVVHERNRVAIDFDQIVERVERPERLAQRRSIYGVRVPDSSLKPFYTANDLMLLEAICPLPVDEEIGLLFVLENDSTTQVFSTFGYVRGNVQRLMVRFSPSGNVERLETRSAALHRALKVQDLLS